MSVVETHQSYGSWSIELIDETPQRILDLFRAKDADTDGFLGHIIITEHDYEDPDEVDVLAEARYAGPFRSYEFSKESKKISGSGMVYWLGEADQPDGPGISQTLEDYTGQDFPTALTSALAGSTIELGSTTETGSLPTGRYLLKTSRYKVEDICAQFEAEYIVTPQGKLNAGTPANLFPTFNDPLLFVTRGPAISDPNFDLISVTEGHVGAEDQTLTEKLLAREENEQTTISGSATQVTAKRGINNTLVSWTSVSGESDEDPATANLRAAALLALEGKTRRSAMLSANDAAMWKLRLGERIYVWDPASGYYDRNNQQEFGGETYWPSKEVVVGMEWPLVIQQDGSKPGVYFRETFDGKIHRLTDFILWEGDLRDDPEAGVVDVEIASAPKTLIRQSNTPLGPIVGSQTNPEDPPPAPGTPIVSSDERQFYVTVPTTGFPLSVTKVKIYASETTGFTVDATTYRGDIPVSRANILLGQTVKGRFPWPATSVFLRASALNSKEGPASAEVTDTVPLIPSVAILNLIADKIDAGTIAASVKMTAAHIVGGVVETADSDQGNVQRVALEEGEPDKIKFYSGASNETREGSAFSSVQSPGPSEFLFTGMVSPHMAGQGSAQAQIALYSPKLDGSAPAIVGLSTFDTTQTLRADVLVQGLDIHLVAESVGGEIIASADSLVDIFSDNTAQRLTLDGDDSKLFAGRDIVATAGRNIVLSSSSATGVIDIATDSFNQRLILDGDDSRLFAGRNALLVAGSIVGFHIGGVSQVDITSGKVDLLGNTIAQCRRIKGTTELGLGTDAGSLDRIVLDDLGTSGNSHVKVDFPGLGFRRLKRGAVDSGGVGFRTVIIDN